MPCSLPFLPLLSDFQLEPFISQLDHCAMSSLDLDHPTGGLPDLRIELGPFSRYIIPKVNEEKFTRVRSTCAKLGEAKYCQDSSPTRFPFNLYGRICEVWPTQEAWQRFGAQRFNWSRYQNPRAHIKSLSSSDAILPVCQFSHGGIVRSGNGGSPHGTGVQDTNQEQTL